MTPLEQVLSKLPDHKRNGDGYIARCPGHDDRVASLCISAGENGRVLLKCQAGCPTENVLARINLFMSDLFPPRTGENNCRIVKTYSYHDEHNDLLFEVVRYSPKDFRQRRPDGKGGWAWKMSGVRRVVYRLPELLAADPAAWDFIPEGEKDSDRLATLGLIATCNVGGAGKWHTVDPACLQHFRGRRVAVLADNDDPGRQHAAKVAYSLHGIAAEVKIIELAGLSSKGDVSDWLDGGGTAEKLLKIVEAAPVFTPNNTPIKPTTQNKLVKAVPYRSFPLDVLPETLSRFIGETASALGCDPAYVALPALATTASAIGTTRVIELKASWCEPSVVWTAVLARSGTLKSPAHDKATDPHRRMQIEALRQYETERAEYERAVLDYEVKLTAWKREAAKSTGTAGDHPVNPVPPTAARYLVSDTTVEALAPILEVNPRGVLLARDELAGWIRGLNQYKAGKGGDVAAWLELWRAGTVIVDRKTGDKRTIYVPRAAVSVCGTIQPGTLADVLSTEYFESGFAARLLLANPPELPKRWSERVPSRAAIDGYERTIRELLALEHADGEYGPEPVRLPLTPEAHAVWSTWYDRHAERTAETGDANERAALAKIEAYAVRFALIFALVADPGAVQVDADAITAGTALADWFAYEAARVYAALGQTDEERGRGRLVDLIQRKGNSVSVRDWQRSRSHKNAGDAEVELNELVNAGYGRWHVPPQAGPGHPTKLFILTPDTTDTDRTPPSDSKPGIVSVSEVSEVADNNAPATPVSSPADDDPPLDFENIPEADGLQPQEVTEWTG